MFAHYTIKGCRRATEVCFYERTFRLASHFYERTFRLVSHFYERNYLDAHEAGIVHAESAELGIFLVADGGFFRGGAEILQRLAPFLGLADELIKVTLLTRRNQFGLGRRKKSA